MLEAPCDLSPVEQARLQALAAALDAEFVEGFVLTVCQHGCTTLLSSMSPRDLLATLKIAMAQCEGQPLTPGHA
jgi:hypothetical protein